MVSRGIYVIFVLLVDDEPDVLEVTRLFLERDGSMKVDLATSVTEGLKLVNKNRYDAIVCDYKMPGLDGLDLLKALKMQGIVTPVIFFTGKGREEVVIEALNYGAYFYLQKGEDPRFQFSKLKKVIRLAVQQKQTEEQYWENKICVVIPAHNEEQLIGETLVVIPEYIHQIYVIDDASEDKTSEIVQECQKKDPRIVLLKHKENEGVGAAITTGYKQALKDEMDIAVVMGGDNQMDPKFLPDVIDPILNKYADYTLGNRLLSPEYRKGMSKWRFLGNAILTMLTKIAAGYWQMMDPQNGYTAISKRALERINLDDIYPRYGYCNDLLVKLNVYGFKIKNVPHPARYGKEKSGIRYSTYILRVSKLLFKDFLWRMKMKYVVLSFHPLVFFYLFGCILGLVGIFTGIYALYYKFFLGNAIFVPGILSLIIFMMGLMFILFAMLFDMEQEKGMGWY